MSIDPGIKRLHIGLANTCNHRCIMCFIKDYSVVLPEKVWKESLLGLYPQLNEIIVSGGEPTVIKGAKDFIKLVKEVNPNIKFALFTNGQEFNEEWIELIKNNVSWVNFSLNAAKKETYEKVQKGGDWYKVISNIIRVRDTKRIKVQTSFVVLKENYKEAHEFIELSSYLGSTHTSFFFDGTAKMIPNLDPEYTKMVLEEAKKYSNMTIWGLDIFKDYVECNERPGYVCNTVKFNLYVDIYGDVRYCCLILHPDGVMGNLTKNTLEEILNTEKAKKIKQDILNGKLDLCSPYCSPITKEAWRGNI
jgi:MoaA/NifB/PqqE/SkfB family radical SAM enzyme